MDGVVKKNDDSTQYFSWPIPEIKENKFVHKYGYYECRCKMQQMDGWWCAFWLQSPIIGSTLSPEISGIEVDIMEQFEKNNTIQHNNYWNGYSSQIQQAGPTYVTLEATRDDYQTFGLDWTADYYRYDVDGRLTLEIKANDPFPVSQTEQFLLLTTEAIGYRFSTWNCWDDTKKAVGDKWIVDYVRVFERK
jgi:beta-glucanase (GH16 family)